MIRLAAIATLATLALPASAQARAVPITAASPSASPVCHEDERCWNWATMGNRSRGIVTTGGRRMVVTPPTFRRLALAGRIDWQRSPHLRGDATARRVGCA